MSAINDCETCVRAHEHAVIEAGISADAVLDAVRIAATVHGATVALDAPRPRSRDRRLLRRR